LPLLRKGLKLAGSAEMHVRLSLLYLALVMGACAPVAEHEDALAAPHTPLGDLEAAFSALPGQDVGEVPVRPLLANVDAWTERWRLLAGAETSIDMNYFILTQDIFGMAVLGHLLHKAEQGVRVRLLLDTMGNVMGLGPDREDCLPALVGVPGVDIRIYRPLLERLQDALRHFNPLAALASNHDKILVIDGASSLIGGRNIEARYFAHAADLADAFHDIDLTLETPAAAAPLIDAFERIYLNDQIQSVDPAPPAERLRCLMEMRRVYRLMDDWLQPGPVEMGPDPEAPVPTTIDDRWSTELARFPRLRGAMSEPRPKAVRARVIVLNSLPRVVPQLDPITLSLFYLLHGSSRQVLIASPYLVLTEDAVQALVRTGERGVPIVTLTNSPVSTDNPLSAQLFIEQWPELMAAVPNLRLFAGGTKRNLHGKLTVFDGTVSLVGAYNLDPISLTMNGELAAAVWSEELAARFAVQPRQLIDQGPPVVYEYRIERDAEGAPLRDADGAVTVAFGPTDHSDPDTWEQPPRLWRLLRLAVHLPAGPSMFQGL
jgi:cardiolipin synthase C